jgi:cytochrome oxidase Cu insertion factor (SCO1/SenC/PrrC family)
MQQSPKVDPARRQRARRTLALLALVCAAPVVASYVAYYWLRPDARTNYGELLTPGPVPEIEVTLLDGARFRLSGLQGRWVLLMTAGASCDASCQRKLYATRQARTIQGREQDRIVRVLLRPDGAPQPAAELEAAHPGMVFVRGDPRQWEALPGRGGADAYVYLVDPHGNLILRYPAEPDIRKLAKDLERLLRASSIG